MKSPLEKFLNVLIVPQYEYIVDVKVKKLGGFDLVDYYIDEKKMKPVSYKGKTVERKNIFQKGHDYPEIMEKTVQIWKMMGPEENSDIIVNFKPKTD